MLAKEREYPKVSTTTSGRFLNTTRKFQTDPDRNTAKQHSPASQIAPQPKRKEPGDKAPETNKNDTGTTFTTEITTAPTAE